MKWKNVLKVFLVVAICFLMVQGLFSAEKKKGAGKKTEIAIVVKLIGIPWFSTLEKGVKKAADELGVNAYMVGPPQADEAQQVKMVEDLIAKGVNAIGV